MEKFPMMQNEIHGKVMIQVIIGRLLIDFNALKVKEKD
jgi:hypothetical protein